MFIFSQFSFLCWIVNLLSDLLPPWEQPPALPALSSSPPWTGAHDAGKIFFFHYYFSNSSLITAFFITCNDADIHMNAGRMMGAGGGNDGGKGSRCDCLKPLVCFYLFFIWTILIFLSRLCFGSPNSLQTIEPDLKWEECQQKKGPRDVDTSTSLGPLVSFFFSRFLTFYMCWQQFSVNYYSSLGQVYDGLAIMNNRCHVWVTGNGGEWWGIPWKGFDNGDQQKEGQRDIDMRQRLFGPGKFVIAFFM